MKKQKVLAALLALSMVAANVANAPAFVYANAYVPTQEDGTANGAVSDTTVTLANTVTDGAIVWIAADDSVTVKMEAANVYSKMLQKGESEPTNESDFDSGLDADTGIGEISAATKLYLLKTGTGDGVGITQKQDFILVEVKKDSEAPTIAEVTAGGINYKAGSDETVYVKDISALQLSAVANDGEGSGIAKIEYVTAGAFETGWNSNSGNYTGWTTEVPALASGEYLCVKVTDQVGNISYAQTKKFVADNTAPTISVTDESGELTYDVTTDCPITGAAIKLKAVDAVSGIASAKYCISHGAIANPATDTDESDWVDFKSNAESGKVIGSSEGFDVNDENYLYVHVVDNAGNEAYYSSGKITYVPGSLSMGFNTAVTASEYTPEESTVTEENVLYFDLDSKTPKFDIHAEAWSEIQAKHFSVKTILDDGVETEYNDNNTGLTVSAKGKHKVIFKLYDNGRLIATKEYNFVNMKDPSPLSLSPSAATYDGTPLRAGHGFTAIDGATYTYYADDQGTNQLIQAPVDAGIYYVKASKPENLATGDKSCESAVTEVSITKADVTKSLGTVLVKVDDLAAHEIATSALLSGYTVSAGAVLPDDASVSLTDSNNIFATTTPAINAAGNIVYQIDSGKAADNTAEILATYSCYKNYTVKLKATIKLIAAETVIKELNVTQAGTTYGTSLPELSYALSDGTVIADEDRTIAYAKADGTAIGDAMSATSDAGDYMVTVSYTSTGAIATKTVNFTIAKKPITLTAKSYTIKKGEALPASFGVTSSAALAYTDSYASEPTATCAAADSNTVGTYVISVNPVTVNDGKTGNYAFTYVAGTLTINEAAQQGGNTNPPSTYEPSTGGTTTKPEDTKKPEDNKKPENTDTSAQSNEIVVNDHGDKMIVDANGTAVKDAKVVVNGKTYLTDGDGVIITNSFATTTAGNTVFCGKDGAVVKRKMVSVEGKKYYATKTGAIAKDQLVSVEGKKYYATKTGVVAVKKFVTTASGKKVYCSKTGAIVTNKVFTVNGAKYIANKSGVIYKNRWVTKGTKKYYVNKSGKVTKVKTVK